MTVLRPLYHMAKKVCRVCIDSIAFVLIRFAVAAASPFIETDFIATHFAFIARHPYLL